MPGKSNRKRGARKPGTNSGDDAELAKNVAAEIASWYHPPAALPPPTESNEAINAKMNGLIGRRIEFRAPDGRVFIVPPTEPIFAGTRVHRVLDIESQTRTRLKEGENPNWFVRLYDDFQKRRDPSSGVSFAEYAAARHPDRINAVPNAAAGQAGIQKTGRSESAAPDPVLEEIDEKILKALAKYRHTLKLTDLAMKADCDRDTCSNHAAYLETIGYAARKENKPRSGVSITEAGRTRLNRISPSPT